MKMSRLHPEVTKQINEKIRELHYKKTLTALRMPTNLSEIYL
jgi:hypothetical protein